MDWNRAFLAIIVTAVVILAYAVGIEYDIAWVRILAIALNIMIVYNILGVADIP